MQDSVCFTNIETCLSDNLTLRWLDTYILSYLRLNAFENEDVMDGMPAKPNEPLSIWMGIGEG